MSLENSVLDILGQQPAMHKLYTQICSIYAVPDSSNHDTIINTLRNGLDKMTESLPWLAGEVINEGASEGDTGVYKIIRAERIPLIVKNHQQDTSAPTMKALRESNFPISMLDEKTIAPCLTINLPGNTVGLAAHSAPVFAVQANFITDGLILTFVGQHNVMDMTGQDAVIGWLDKICHRTPLTQEDISIGNMDRTKTVSLFGDDYKPGPELDEQMIRPPPAEPDAPSAPATSAPSTWAYVTFSATALESLKIEATKTITLPSGFVSTDDALCAFIWKCVSHARITRLAPNTKSSFARAVDIRQRMGLPISYPGMFQNMTYQHDTLQSLAEEPLGVIASELRRQLDPKVRDLVYNARSLATYLTRTPDKSKVSFTACVDIPSGIALSSWARINCYDHDFNLGLGKPEVVRRPGFMPVESLLYFMPRSSNGEMAVAICLRDEDWVCLRADEEFRRYATYIG
ncbi:Transferase [Penicillium herquei]|nr:Transferase [Penicillium herquei]